MEGSSRITEDLDYMGEEELQTEADQRVTLTHAARSDIGRRREENQDSFGIIEGDRYRLFIVADGMGGVRGGALASSLAVETIKQFLSSIPEPTPNDVVQAVRQANTEIFAKGSADPSLSGMGTTLVALFFSGSKLFVINVGDSRAYRFRVDQVDRLSEDHTLVMELLRSGTIDANQAQNHPVSHMLTRSLGPAEEVEVDCTEIVDGPFESDIYLICSDGLYNLIKDSEMLALLQENQLDGAAEKLVELANNRGGTDNITVIAVELGDGYPALPDEYSSVEYVVPVVEESAAHANEKEESVAVQAEAVQAKAANPAESGATAEQAKTSSSAEQSTNGAGPHLNGSGEVESRIDIEHVREAYQEAKAKSEQGADKKAESKSRFIRKEAQSRPKQPRPSVLQTTEAKSGIFATMSSELMTLLGFSICGVMVGVLISTPEPSEDIPVRRPAETQTAYQASRPEVGSGGNSRGGQERTRPAEAGNDNFSRPSSNGIFPGSLEAGLSTIERRRRTLSTRLKQVDDKLSALDGPIAGSLGQALGEANRQLEMLDQRMGELRSEVDSASRGLAIWTGRRKRLETTEPINLVSEVAVSSEEVRRKKEAFESATWQYLKEAERLEYTPNDPQIAQNVADLVRQRNQRMDELFLALRASIDNAILESQQKISDVTVEKDRVDLEMRNLQDTIAFSRLLTSSDRTARATKRSELARERELILAELNELNRLADTLPALRTAPVSARSGQN